MRVAASQLLVILACAASAPGQVATVPERTEDNLIVAAYNIQWFGEKPHNNAKLAEVIRHFDVCGIIELKGEEELVDLVRELETLTGKDWGFGFGVRTHRPSGRYHEAYGAVWRRDRVELGDGVIGGIWDLAEAYRNDPYVISFKRKNFDFILGLLHTRWTDDDEGTRKNEVAMIAEHIKWMKGFIGERDLVLAGDFNYSLKSKELKRLVEVTDLKPLDKNPKSTFKTKGTGYASSYDHMFSGPGTTEYVDGSCNTLDVTTLVYGNRSKANMLKARDELSDHLPIFAVFNVAGADDD